MKTMIRAEHVSIGYKIGDFKDIGLKEWTMRHLKHNYHVENFMAVNDVSFELQEGDMLGIIGANGAGKTTLLKAVIGVMEPRAGHIEQNGSVSALLELTSGFDGDLTVKENAYLRGAMLGYTKEFMDATYGDIIAFAELEDFQDRPFKQLSTGMQSRLAFSIASLVQPEILILDEVLSVGDGAFQEKSAAKMREIISGGAATILVSHSLGQIRELCNKVLWLDKGRQIAFGDDVQGICDQYEDYLAGRIELPMQEFNVDAAQASAEGIVMETTAPGKSDNRYSAGRNEIETSESIKKGGPQTILDTPPKGRLEREFAFFKEFIFKNRWWLLLFGVLLLCVYSAWIVSPELNIDSDAYITDQGTRWGGGHIGRQGYTLVKILLGMENFNPYFASVAGWLFLWLSGVAMGYVLYRFGLRAPVFCAVVGLFIFISPINENHFYWYHRLVSLAIGYMLCAVSVGLSYYGIFKKKKLCGLLSVLGMIWALCIHQSFALVYVVFAIAAYLLLFRRWAFCEAKRDVPFFSAAVKQFLLFVLAYGINTAVTYIFFFNDSGFSEMVMLWGTVPFSQSIHNILYFVKMCLFGGAYYTTSLYGVLALCAVVGAVTECWKSRGEVKGSYRLLYITAVITMQFVPFLMAVYQGGEPPVHGQMAYPMVMAGDIIFLAGLTVYHADKKRRELTVKFFKAAVTVVAVVLLWNQSQMVMRLIYTDSIRVEEDKNTALEITERVHEASLEKKPLVFIGYYTNTLNPACQRGEYIGTSVLGWDNSLGVHYLNGSQRTVQFFNTMGAGLTAASDPDMVMRARKTAMNMPAWPAAGSVADGGDCVIVKLCEDEWPEEVIEPSESKAEFQPHPVNGQVSVYIDSMELVDGNLKIRGTVNQSNDSYVSWKPKLYMLNTGTGEWHALNTVKMGRPGMYIDGMACPNSAFMALSPWDGVFDNSEEYVFLFEYRDLGTGKAYWVIPQMAANLPVAVPRGGLPDEQTKEKIDLPLYSGFYCTGVTVDSSLALTSDIGPGGCILWGPYAQSVAGTYDITLHYTVEDAPEGAVGTFDVALDTEQIAAATFTAENESVTLEDVVIEGGHLFEARVYVPEGAAVRIQSIEYERVS